MLRELAMRDALDALIPPHERNVVTVGECIEALVLTILTGEHALSRVADTFVGYDLEVIFQRPLDAAHFHDHRLDRAIEQYALDLARLHTDTTSLKVYGALCAGRRRGRTSRHVWL
jgi:hypothetical protein